MIKKIRLELVIICLLILNIFLTSIIDINFFKRFNDFDISLGNIYFKNFFIKITEVGNSFWFFTISVLGYAFCFFYTKISKNILISKLKNFYLFLFVSLFFTGALTQIIKHLVGRPRPSYGNESEFFGINFFSLESSFHSFPSGHTSTIFIVALVLSLLTPKIKYFYLFFAFIVGLSRFVVGAHYLSDVIAGIAIAFVGIKLTLWFFKKIQNETISEQNMNLDLNLYSLSLIILIITIIYFTIGSSLDVFISGLFYRGNEVFLLQSFSYITILAREIFLPLMVLYILVLPIISLYLPINKIYFGFRFRIKEIFFLWCCLIFNNIFIVNLFLKNFWGRARPNDILELGGEEFFTPWFTISESCSTNCSFVSGDASVGFSLIVLFFLTKNKVYFWLALFSGIGLGIVRILEGGHFTSDVVIAGFVIFCLTFFESKFFKKIG